jgi:DNA-binding PadR family transcriptional regulator
LRYTAIWLTVPIILPLTSLTGFGRYADPALVIMTSLAEGPKHGYAIIRDIKSMGGPTLRPGTLYGALVRLEHRGLVVALDAEDRRRPYQLTDQGLAALTAQLAHVEHVAAVGRARLSTS